MGILSTLRENITINGRDLQIFRLDVVKLEEDIKDAEVTDDERAALRRRALHRRLLFTFVRDFLLAFSVRAALGFLPQLLKALKTRSGILHLFSASLGKESFRFAMALSGYFTGFKALENLIKYLRHGKVDGWNAFVSGTIASSALFFESAEQRVTFAQYLAVRALQTLFNEAQRRNVAGLNSGRFAHGDTLLFCLSCAQVVYSFVNRPETLPLAYRGFLSRLVNMNAYAVACVGHIVRNKPVDLSPLVIEASRKHGIPEGSLWASLLPGDVSASAVVGMTQTQLISATQTSAVMPCALIHPANAHCMGRILSITLETLKMVLPMYFSLHLAPVLLFRYKDLIPRFKHYVEIVLKNTFRSSSFLATFIAAAQSMLCAQRSLILKGVLVQDSKYFYALLGLLPALSILIELKSRRTELLLYVLPKALNCCYAVCCEHGYWRHVDHSEMALFSLSMGVLMYFYRNQPRSLSPVVEKVLKRFL